MSVAETSRARVCVSIRQVGRIALEPTNTGQCNSHPRLDTIYHPVLHVSFVPTTSLTQLFCSCCELFQLAR